MFVFSNFLSALAQVLEFVLTALYWIIIFRALISWVNPDPANGIVMFLTTVTEPILEPIRRMLPFSLKFGIDISPLIAILIVVFIKSFVVRTLVEMSFRLG